MEVEGSLLHRVELFRNTGSFFRNLEELFSENSWLQVMMGQGVEPLDIHPVAKHLTDDNLIAMMQRLSVQARQQVEALPTHKQFLKENFG